MTATPVQSQFFSSSLLALSPAGMREVADIINRKTAALARSIGVGRDRTFRSLRTAELTEWTGLSDRQIRDWRRTHKATLESYKGDSETGLPQLPLNLAEMHRMMDDFAIRPRRPEGSRALRLGCFNFKGGSTKTSTTLHLATYFAILGWRTLVIDADPQGSLSTMFGFSPEDVPEEHTLLPAMGAVTNPDEFEGVRLKPLSTHVDGLDIIPAALDLIGADFSISAAFMNKVAAPSTFYNCVNSAIEEIEDDYDIVLIDGAPAFSFSALAVMWASDGMIIPVPPASPDFKATASFCAMASDALERLAVRASVPERSWAPVMFVHNRVRGSNQSAKDVQTLSKDAFGRYRCDITIPDNSAIPGSLLRHMSVFEATSADVDTRGLRQARTAYGALGNAVLDAIKTCWEAGFAVERPHKVAKPSPVVADPQIDAFPGVASVEAADHV